MLFAMAACVQLHTAWHGTETYKPESLTVNVRNSLLFPKGECRHPSYLVISTASCPLSITPSLASQVNCLHIIFYLEIDLAGASPILEYQSSLDQCNPKKAKLIQTEK